MSASTAAGIGERRRPYHVLVCDDDRSVVRAFKAALEAAGHRVEAAFDGEEALAKALAGSFEVVLLDSLMPRLGAFEVLKRIRQNRGAENLFVIVQTAKAEDQDVYRAYQSGADMYVRKPYPPNDLVNLLSRLP